MRVNPRSLVRRLNSTCAKTLEDVVAKAASQRFYEIGVEHLLLGILEVEDGDADHMFRFFRRDRVRAASEVERCLQGMRTGNQSKPTLAETLFNWIENAWVVASLERGAVQLRSADLLAEFSNRPGRYTSESLPELEALDPEAVVREFEESVRNSKESLEVPKPGTDGGDKGTSRPAAAGREALDRFTVSFTGRAQRGEIDPIFGRDREVRKVIDILARRRKNNPIIVGEPGVGKTALVEGLALAIVAGEVPKELRGVELVGLDMGLLKAGAGVRGELENRLKKVIAEVKASPTPIIVFIDEAHTLVGGGGGQDADIPNLLKPALARGEFRTVAATTYSEYKKYFEKDPALERRFQPVQLDEPSVDDTIVMLRGLRATYENAHQVVIRDEAILAAATLSDRFITGRYLPDKAVDLLDTAAARVKIERDAPPQPLVALRSLHASLSRELEARRRDLEDASGQDPETLTAIRERMSSLLIELAQMEERLGKERDAITNVLAAQTAYRGLAADADGKADAKIRLEGARAALYEVQGEHPLVHPEVDRDAIGQVVSDWTGIPVGKMKSSSIEVMLSLEEKLGQRIKGQLQATTAVAEAVRMSHAGVRNPNTPVAVFLFVGPSGVGKTETALALADLLYGGERSMITINMSEFQEKHTVSRLIGSPPGYVGYGEGGVLTEAVRHKPYSVVLLDECEKADLEVMNLFYQVFDKGTLSDGEGRVINFRNTVMILTSNLATDHIMALHAEETPSVDALVEKIRPILSKHFKPALLARMTIVPYRPMAPEVLAEIATLKLRGLASRLETAHGVSTTFEQHLVHHLVSRCVESETGARALDHAMRGSLMPNLAKAILEQLANGGVPAHLSIGLDAHGGWAFRFSDESPGSSTLSAPVPPVE